MFLAHHIVHILPVVQGDQLEGCQHGPQQVVEAGESVVWIFSNTAETDETVRTGSEFLIKYQSNSHPRYCFTFRNINDFSVKTNKNKQTVCQFDTIEGKITKIMFFFLTPQLF